MIIQPVGLRRHLRQDRAPLKSVPGTVVLGTRETVGGAAPTVGTVRDSLVPARDWEMNRTGDNERLCRGTPSL